MQEIQTMLMALGYDLGDWGSDGRYGSKTKTAVLAFQKAYMPESDGWDGKPGTKTQTALRKAEAARTMEQLVAAQDSPEQAEQLVDECFPTEPTTWGSGNVCVFDGSRWVRKKAQVAAAPKTQSSGTTKLGCDPVKIWTWDLRNGGICLTNGKTTYLSKWLPENMFVELPYDVVKTGMGAGKEEWHYATIYTRTGASRPWTKGGQTEEYGSSGYPDASEIITVKTGSQFGDRVEFAQLSNIGTGQWRRLNLVRYYSQWISAVRSLALNFPEISFRMNWGGKPRIISEEGMLYTTKKEYEVPWFSAGHHLIDEIGKVIQEDLD